MEKETLMKNLRDAISDVMETMFFQLVQVSDVDGTIQEWFSRDQCLLGATLTFDGPLTGSLYLLMPAEMVDAMTCDFLGLEKDTRNEDQKRDMIKEALNMIGGRAFSMSDRTGAYQIGIPALLEESALTHKRLGDLESENIFIETENHNLAISIVFDRNGSDPDEEQ
jgi:hypothetical protein